MAHPGDLKQRSCVVTIMPNSIEGRDIAYQMHPNVNLRKYEKTGGLVIESGDGIYVTDNNGKRYIEGLAGLWSVALGFGEKRLAEVAKAQMEKLPYYHTFAYKTHGTAPMRSATRTRRRSSAASRGIMA
jgi:4-aminobutyrate--pyruvate transaminase